MMQLMVEEMMMNAWPALRTVVHDGWFVRFANGYTKRANAVYPLYGGQGAVEQCDAKIQTVERLYAEQGQPAIFKLTDDPGQAALDERLVALGYEKEGLTAILTRSLADVEEPAVHTVEMSLKATERWLSSYAEMVDMREALARETLKQIVGGIMQPTCFFTLYEGGRDIACGSAVLERNYVGLYDIATAPAYRNQGYGKQLVLNILRWARMNGASNAYLAVVLDNKPAVKLYSNAGFSETYRYWYRVK